MAAPVQLDSEPPSLMFFAISYVFPGDVPDIMDVLDLSFMSDHTHRDRVLTHLRRHVLVHFKAQIPQNQVAWSRKHKQNINRNIKSEINQKKGFSWREFLSFSQQGEILYQNNCKKSLEV